MTFSNSVRLFYLYGVQHTAYAPSISQKYKIILGKKKYFSYYSYGTNSNKYYSPPIAK